MVLFGVLICFVAAFLGGIGCLVMSGVGICPAGVSGSLFGTCCVGGAALSAVVAGIWPKAWSVGALAFSIPALLGLVFAVGLGDRSRILAILGCIFGAWL